MKKSLGFAGILVISLFILLCGRVKIAPPDLAFYYSFAHSMIYDGDFCFIDQYAHFSFAFHELYLTDQGYPANDWPMGTGVCWLPFLGAARIFTGIAALMGVHVDASGYGWFDQWVVTLGATILYGGGALWASYRLCRSLGISSSAARWATLLIGMGSSFTYHLYVNSADSHPPSAFFIALFLLGFIQNKNLPTKSYAFLSGCALGVAGLIRPHNFIFIMIPAWDWIFTERKDKPFLTFLREIGIMSLGAFLVFIPQLLVWKVLYGSWLAIPRSDEVLWLQPHLYEMLFSDFHGMISWSPLFGLGLLGLLSSRKYRRFAAPVILQIYVYSCNLAWWAGGSFGNRRMLGCTPLLIVGLAALLEIIPKTWLKIFGILCGFWTFSLLSAELAGAIQLDHYQPWGEMFHAVYTGFIPGLLAHFPHAEWTKHGGERCLAFILLSLLSLLGYFFMKRLRLSEINNRTRLVVCGVLLFNLFCVFSVVNTPKALASSEVTTYSHRDRFNWVVWYEKGFYLLNNNRPDEALEALIAAVVAEPRHPQPWMYAAFIFRQYQWSLPAYHYARYAMIHGERFPDFFDLFETILNDQLFIGYQSSEILYNERGVIRALRKLYDAAENDFKSALAAKPDYQPAQDNLKILENHRNGKSEPFYFE